MTRHPLSKKHWYYVALSAVLLGLWFVGPFLGVVAIAALMAFLFYGIYERLQRRLRPAGAAFLTFIASVFIILVPIIIILFFTAIQLTALASHVHIFSEGEFAEGLSSFVHWLNTVAAPLTGNDAAVSISSITEFIRNTLPAILRGVAGFLTGVVGGFPMALALTITYIILFYEFLIYGKKLGKSIVALSPFQPEITKEYLRKIGLMANAMAKGQLYISFIISLLTALILGLCLGAWDYFFLMTVVFTLLNLIPLGSGIVVMPVIILAMLTGALIPGLIALILYVIISNIDTLIRPKIIPRDVTLSPGLTALSAFGGIALFGIIGVVYGPILMIIVVISIQMYLQMYNDRKNTEK